MPPPRRRPSSSPWPTSTERSDAVLGDDLRYWIAAARFALALAYRQRLMPTLRQEDGAYAARWYPLLDEPSDRQRFEGLVAAMPPACPGARPHPRCPGAAPP